MATDTPNVSGTYETPADAGKGDAGLVRLWLNAIDLADESEKEWRKRSVEVTKRYRNERKEESQKRGFPILYANTETTIPAILNSAPTPDVRRRYGDGDDDGTPARKAAQVLERGLSFCSDEYDFFDVLKDAVKDRALVGRGVTRVRYEPMKNKAGDAVVYHKLWSEHVPWDGLRVGPARRWSGVPWIAFPQLLTRDQYKLLNPKIGASIPLDYMLDGSKVTDRERPVPEVFKRGLCWEIWDKNAREVLWIAPAYPDGPVARPGDPLGLQNFYPIPRPMYAIETTDTLVPVEPFRIYKDQADELDKVSARIMTLTDACKVRGIYNTALSDAFDAMKANEDGEYAPSANAMQFAADGLDNAIWSWPLETIVATLKQLYENRDQIKQVIFELTGIADIMRGSTEAQETKGAQQLKTQWGTLRIQPAQQDVQRYARDLYRIKAELFGEKFDPQTMSMITGIDCNPQPVQGPDGQPVIDPQTGQPQMQPNPIPALLKSDQLRSYRIDIETDSTIRGDVAQAQEQIGTFIKGTAEFWSVMGPLVQEGAMPKPTAIDMFAGFARQFKLGKSAEDSLDKWQQAAREEAKQPKPEQVDPEVQKMQMEAQLKQQELSANMQAKQAELQLKEQEMQAKLAFEQQKMQLEMQKHQQQMEMDQAKHGADMQMKGQELEMREREGQMSAQLEAAKIADGQMARQEDRMQMDAKAAGLPEGQKSHDFMQGTGDALKVATDRLNGLGEILADVARQVAEVKASADDTFEADIVPGPDGRAAMARKRYASGKVVEIPIRRAKA
jgi:hypothetical protein